MVLLFSSLANHMRKKRRNCKGPGYLWTSSVYIRDEIAIPNIGEKLQRYMSYLLTIFFFVLFLNILDWRH
jgi:F-type H+-transporting ATPase subunit a